MCDAWKAPIYYHSSRDGLGTHLLNTYLEIVDIYGLFILAFVFTTAIVYYRNSIYDIFASMVNQPTTSFSTPSTQHSTLLNNSSYSYSVINKNNSNHVSELKGVAFITRLVRK